MINIKEKILGGWLGDRILTSGQVTHVDIIGAAYRCITVVASALRGKAPAPGDKVQVFLPGIGTRTYTPFDIQEDGTSFKLLAYVHGATPGSAWAAEVKVGDELRFVGPEGSIRLRSLSSPIALFGDETSLAVAHSLFDVQGERAFVLLEVNDLDGARAAGTRLGLSESIFIKRSGESGFYSAITPRLASWLDAGGTLVLTGCAQSIQRVRDELRKIGKKPTQKVKPYWSAGKTGLD